MVAQAGRGRVGAQGERLLQAAHTGAVPAGQGRGLAPREAAVSRTAGGIFPAQAGGQAAGIPRPAAGKARVEPGVVRLAGERSGLAVPGRQAAGRLVAEVAGARVRESVVVFVFLPSVQPLPAEQGVIGEGALLREGAAAVGARGGVWLGDSAGSSLLRAHGLIVLLGRVAVAAKVPAQLADVTVSETRVC